MRRKADGQDDRRADGQVDSDGVGAGGCRGGVGRSDASERRARIPPASASEGMDWRRLKEAGKESMDIARRFARPISPHIVLYCAIIQHNVT